MKYPKSDLYRSQAWLSKIMGPNPMMLAEELLLNHQIPQNAYVCDLGSGQGVTSIFLAKEYGFRVAAADLWSDPQENRTFFHSLGLTDAQITPMKVDAANPCFEAEAFDAVISIDSYHYFGRDVNYLNRCLLPYVKKGGYVYIAIPGMHRDLHQHLPAELLLSWNAEDLDTMHDCHWWRTMVEQSDFCIETVAEMETNQNAWDDWLAQENEYAIGDRKSMNAGAGKYLNFVKIVLRKK